MALSGGRDSVTLLHLLHGLAGPLHFSLSALHVNHGLSPNARLWENFCRALCARLGVPFNARRVRVARDSGSGIEAAARAARYSAFAGVRADCIVLAHHQDDQAETLLLQLLRGAGVKGLAAMGEIRHGEYVDTLPATPAGAPAARRAAAPLLLRPNRLAWIDDESNADARFDRNWLRHRVAPLLRERFPAYVQTVARTAGHLAEAAALLDQLARIDAGTVCPQEQLSIEVLRSLSGARARNLLRWYIAARGAPPPNAQRLEQMLSQLVSARADANPRIVWDRYEMLRYRDLALARAIPPPLPPDFRRPWNGAATLALPELGGSLHFRSVGGQGIDRAALRAGCEVRLRGGGERLRLDAGRPSRTLKNLLQESAVAPWDRERLPLLFVGGRLAWVPHVGVDAAFRCPPGAPGIVPEWRPEDTRQK